MQKNVYEATEEFVKWFPDYMKIKKVSEKNFLNADEKRVRLDGELHAEVVRNARKDMHAALTLSKGKAASWIPFFNAEGIMLFSVFILPMDKKGEAEVPIRIVDHNLRGTSKVFYGFTETGWSNGHIWRECLRVLIEEIKIRIYSWNFKYTISGSLRCSHQ